MLEQEEKVGLLPLGHYAAEVRPEVLAAWLRNNETERLDVVLVQFRAMAQGLPRAEARRVWREAFAIYAAFGGV